MPNHSESQMKEVEDKLRELMGIIGAILSKAESDSDFSSKLNDIPLNILENNSTKGGVSVRRPRSRQSQFNSVDYLGKNGEDKLREELDSKTNTELCQILKAESSHRKPKEIKSLDRDRLISEIISNALRILNKGSAFLQVKESDDTSSDSGSDVEE